MRWLALLLITCVTRVASASPYEVGWVTVGIGLGASPELSGALADRIEREPCDATCPLSTRMALGGGVGRWGVEIQVATSPVTDTEAMDARDRQRQAFRAGLVGRFTVVRTYGFDLSLRAGIQQGLLGGTSSTTSAPDPTCRVDQVCEPIETTYTAQSHPLWAFPLGATLRFGLREPGGLGYFAVYADFDSSIVRIGFPDGARTGVMQTMTYGFLFGTMFDVR